jgi:hypothetical protein
MNSYSCSFSCSFLLIPFPFRTMIDSGRKTL